jgi:hypothetical protein
MTSFKFVLFVFAACIATAIGTTSNDETINVLVYETVAGTSEVNTLQQQIDGRINGLNLTVFGKGNGFEGFGNKFISLLPLLREMSENSLVIVTDSRDVLVNNPYNDDKYMNTLADDFKLAFEELTIDRPGAIVVSAEAQCCVAALTHAAPGSYFNVDGTRNQIACSSGEAGCLWNEGKADPWELFMKKLMLERTVTDSNVYDDMYLNAGLIAGRAKDLLRVVEGTKMEKSEDDQAVLTDYMFRHPEEIVLDYGQKMFGNNRAGVVGLSKEEKCTFKIPSGENRLYHSKTDTTPLFIHSPGGFYECHDALSKVLGIPEFKSTERELWFRRKPTNYQKPNCAPTKAPISALHALLLQN